ncbi:MAG: hypothetical protein WAX89_04975 [Alphaproteobacteria bacterium]
MTYDMLKPEGRSAYIRNELVPEMMAETIVFNSEFGGRFGMKMRMGRTTPEVLQEQFAKYLEMYVPTEFDMTCKNPAVAIQMQLDSYAQSAQGIDCFLSVEETFAQEEPLTAHQVTCVGYDITSASGRVHGPAIERMCDLAEKIHTRFDNQQALSGADIEEERDNMAD